MYEIKCFLKGKITFRKKNIFKDNLGIILSENLSFNRLNQVVKYVLCIIEIISSIILQQKIKENIII